MEICRPTVAGILESSDCQVTAEPRGGNTEFTSESVVINQYGGQIKRVTMGTLEDLGARDVRIAIVDKGALDCTIRARMEGTVFRTAGQYDNPSWGGAVR